MRYEHKEEKGITGEVFENDIDHLLTALNSAKIDSPLWSSAKGIRFGQSLAAMIRDLKNLVAQLSSGSHDRAIVRETERLRPQLERPVYKRIYYPDMRRRRLSTMVVPFAISVETELEERALAALGDLVENQKLDLLRMCPRCELWFLGTRSDQEYCSSKCRQRIFQNQKKKTETSKQKREKEVKHHGSPQTR
jgi:hypothetical protein